MHFPNFSLLFIFPKFISCSLGDGQEQGRLHQQGRAETGQEEAWNEGD